MICLVSCSKFSDVLPALTCARAIGNLSSICLGANILRLEWSENLPELKNLYLHFLWGIFCCQRHKELFIYHRKVYITVYIFFLLFFLWILRFYFTVKIQLINHFDLHQIFRVILPLKRIYQKCLLFEHLKSYVYEFLLSTKFSLSTVFSISLLLLSSFSVSSLNVFSGITSFIVNFWVLGFKTSNASTCFFFLWSSIVFIYFSNALTSEESVNFLVLLF